MTDHGNPTPKQVMTLNPGEDFRRVFRLADGPFPAGAALYYRLHTTPTKTWTATISGALATFAEPSTDVDTVPKGTEWQLMYNDPALGDSADDTEVCWGTVARTHRKGLPG